MFQIHLLIEFINIKKQNNVVIDKSFCKKILNYTNWRNSLRKDR